MGIAFIIEVGMPSVGGFATEEQLDTIQEMIDNGQYEGQSEFVQASIAYYLKHKHNVS